MKAFDSRFPYSDPRMLSCEIVELPADMFVCVSNGRYHIGHSATLGKWYAYCETLCPDTKNDVYNNLLYSGTWLDCAISLCAVIDYSHVPFIWGQPIKNVKNNHISCIPFFEIVETGETDEEGFPISEQHYKIMSIISVPGMTTAQTNMNTGFNIEDFGSNLLGMVSYLQSITGIIY